jgi:hypothetical protein
MKGEATFYKSLWERNNGIFYRGTAGGSGLGFGILGAGTYVTWDEGMANAFASISSNKHGSSGIVRAYKLPKSLKLLDYESSTRWEIWKSFGVQNSWDKIGDKTFSRIVTAKLKQMGYDGVISDDKANGICVFERSKLKVIKK